ncbi:MAG: BamA/TamA family outer membrane protein [Acidobacteriota bacterium]|nr:BamA/TamA family outer membrane protein [Acidobacteriota bacterium]
MAIERSRSISACSIAGDDRVRSIIALALALRALTGSSAFAQPTASHIGERIVDVQLVREGRPLVDPAVSALVETRAGQPLSMAQVRESIMHIFGLGRFQDVQVEAVAAPGGVLLRYNVVPLHNVERIDFRGQPALGLSEGMLRTVVTNRFGTSPPVGRAPDAARTIEQLYHDHGYLRATATVVATERHDPDRTLLEFDITPGPRAVIGTAQVEGQPAEGNDAFSREIHAVPGQPYEPTTIADNLSKYVQKLRRKSRYQAAASYQARPSADGTTVDLTITLQTGPVVTIAFEGDPLPKDKPGELVPIAREASVDEDLIEDSIQRIRTFLNVQGHWKADASATRQEGEGTLRIVFTVRRGPQYRVAERGVEIQGNHAVPIEQLRPALIKLQGNDIFVESNLGAAVSAVAGQYQRLGFAQAKIASGVNEITPVTGAQALVQPVITITEGPLTLIGDVTFVGNASVPADQLRSVVSSATGAPYYEPRVVADRDAVILDYRNRGFAGANVVVIPTPTPDGTRADLTFRVTEGQQTIVDHILIIGNTRTDQRVIQRELLLQQGKPLGLEDLIESQRRLGALGLFRRIRIEELSHGGAASDVLVTVEEAAATTFSYGGGLEAGRRLRESAGGQAQERLEFAPRGFFDVGRRNLGGKNRSADLYTRLSLRPSETAAGSTDSNPFGFSEYRIVGTYREPRALGVNADLSFTAAVEQGVRSSFNFARKGVNAEVVRRLGPGLRTSGRYSFGTTRTFDEKLSPEDQSRIDRIFPQVRLSALAGAISRDTRDDVLDPERGTFLSAEGTVATRALGGQVGFLKSYLQGFWFHRLPVKRRIVFASRVALGLAEGFPRTVQSTDAQGQPVTVTVEDLPASERFFAGGDTTIRGFALDTVGAPNTISATGFPRGGNALLVMNAELRLPIWRDLGAALFTDGGNVFGRATEFDLGELRGSVGFGVRYRSPIGPIRFDIGFKMDRREVGGQLEPRRALHFSIGQAF